LHFAQQAIADTAQALYPDWWGEKFLPVEGVVMRVLAGVLCMLVAGCGGSTGSFLGGSGSGRTLHGITFTPVYAQNAPHTYAMLMVTAENRSTTQIVRLVQADGTPVVTEWQFSDNHGNNLTLPPADPAAGPLPLSALYPPQHIVILPALSVRLLASATTLNAKLAITLDGKTQSCSWSFPVRHRKELIPQVLTELIPRKSTVTPVEHELFWLNPQYKVIAEKLAKVQDL